jgi:hypothetical protein
MKPPSHQALPSTVPTDADNASMVDTPTACLKMKIFKPKALLSHPMEDALTHHTTPLVNLPRILTTALTHTPTEFMPSLSANLTPSNAEAATHTP